MATDEDETKSIANEDPVSFDAARELADALRAMEPTNQVEIRLASIDRHTGQTNRAVDDAVSHLQSVLDALEVIARRLDPAAAQSSLHPLMMRVDSLASAVAKMEQDLRVVRGAVEWFEKLALLVLALLFITFVVVVPLAQLWR
jgi:hypothetical protein